MRPVPGVAVISPENVAERSACTDEVTHSSTVAEGVTVLDPAWVFIEPVLAAPPTTPGPVSAPAPTGADAAARAKPQTSPSATRWTRRP
jgi:hypothetical protein